MKNLRLFHTICYAMFFTMAAVTIFSLMPAQAAEPSGAKAFPAGVTQKQPIKQQVQTSVAGRDQAPPIKVEAVALSASPSLPRSGQATTVKLTIRNTGTGVVARIPWAIHHYTGNKTLKQGEKTNLAPGESFEATANWIPSAGTQVLQGYVDPTGKTFKNTAPPSAQVKTLNVNVLPSEAEIALLQLQLPTNIRSLAITLQPDANPAPASWTRPAADPILNQQLQIPTNIRSLAITLQPDANPAPAQWTRPAADPILNQQLFIPTDIRSLQITLQPQ